MSHSQGDEEEVILEAVKGIEKGYVVDIGAYDGKIFSNSRALLEKGWRGLLVEASPTAFVKLVENSRDVNVKLLNGAITTERTMALFQENDPPLSSSLDEKNKVTWAKDKKSEFYVPTFTPADLQAGFPGVPDVITVDIEGPSFEVVKVLAQSWCEGWKVICIEHDDRAVEISQWGKDRSFRVGYLDQQNIVLVRR